MAAPQSSSSDELHPVFITTSLDTRLAVAIHHSCTVSDLNRKVILEHLSSFPRFGEIKIDAVKVKRWGCFYHLHDSMLLRTIFKQKNYWHLYVDASASAVFLEEMTLQNGPFSCEALVLRSEDLNVQKENKGRKSVVGVDLVDARSAEAASGGRKKLKVQESSKHPDQEDLALHIRAKGSGGHGREQTADLTELIIRERDNKGRIIEKKVEKVLPVQEQALIEAESSVQSGLQSGVDLVLISNHECIDEDKADGRAEKDDVSHDSSATNMDQARSSSKKRKKPSQKKESGKNNIVDSKLEHGLEHVVGSQGAIPEAKPKEPANLETGAKRIIDNMTLVEKQSFPVDVGDRSRVQKGLSILLGEKAELSDMDVADGRDEKGEAIPDSFAAGVLETGSSRDKRKKFANRKDSNRKKTAVPTEEHVLKHVEGSQGTISSAKPKEPDNKETVIEETTQNMAVVHDQGAGADAGNRDGVQHGLTLVLEEINGQINEKGAVVSAVSGDDMGENASAKKRKKSTKRKQPSKKKNINANEENLQKHVNGLAGVSSMGPGETHNKETGMEKSGNLIQTNEQALNTDVGDVSGVQNDPEQGENDGEFIEDKGIRGDVGVVAHDPFDIGVMEDKSSIKNRKKPTHTKELSKKKALDPDEKHVPKQDLMEKHGPKHVEGPKCVSSLPEPKEMDNTEKSIEEKLDNVMIVREQALEVDANYGSEVQNGPALLSPGENNRQFLGDEGIRGAERGHVASEVQNGPALSSQGENNRQFLGDEEIRGAEKGRVDNDLSTSGGMVDESSKKKKKKSADKSSNKKIVYPEGELGLKQDPKEMLVLMHVENSIGANSLAETKEADNKKKNIKKSADVVVVHEQTFDDDAGDGLPEENNEQLYGDEANREAEKLNLAPDLSSSGGMEDELSRKKTKKSTSKQTKVRVEEKLALKLDPKEKVAPKPVEDSTGANSMVEIKEADNKEKNMKDKSANVVVVHEQDFDVDAGDRVLEENNEQFNGDEANGEPEKVNLAPDLFASGAMEDELSKKTTKKSTSKQRKKKAVEQDPKEKVVPKHVEDSTGANFSAEAKEADNKEKSMKEKSADVVVVHERTFDADAGDSVQEESNEQFHGDKAIEEVEKVNVAPDLVVSGMVKDISSPKKKKPTQKKNATVKVSIDSCEDCELKNIKSSPAGSSLARRKELGKSKSIFPQVEGNDSVTPVFSERAVDGLMTEVNSQRKGMTAAVLETQRKGKRKQIATDRSVEQEGSVSASSEITKKESRKFISTSDVSKSDNLLASAAHFRASDSILEESGSIKFTDYFTPSEPQVAVAASADTDEVAGKKGNGKINLPNLRKSRHSEASASAIEVTKNNKKRHSNLDRYCVAFRNSSNPSLQASVEGRKRSLLDKSGSIFKDESSGCSDDGQGSGKSDATTRTPSDDTVSSDYSDGDSSALMKSQENGNDSQQNGRRSNMKNLLSSGGKDVQLTKILQSSSRYKMAKKAASQSQEQDSEQVDFVPDSQADV